MSHIERTPGQIKTELINQGAVSKHLIKKHWLAHNRPRMTSKDFNSLLNAVGIKSAKKIS